MPLSHVPALRELLDAALRKYDLADLAVAIHEAAEPCILLYGDDGDEKDAGPVGVSRIGGWPDLPASATWPEHDGQKLRFLAQLDLATLPRFEGDGLPANGLLSCFAEEDEGGLASAILSPVDSRFIRRRGRRG